MLLGRILILLALLSKKPEKYSTMKTSHFRSAIVAAIACAALLLTASLPVRANELQEVDKLYKQGNLPQALEKANNYLVTKPKDAQMRLYKGVILTEQNKVADAIKVFSSLSEDYPELPEPYNNLAVLYASQGQYEKAKNALELAIRTHSSYATAHENLGDIYAKMASEAYGKALQLDKGNAAAQTKLAMIKDLFPSGGKGVKIASAKSAGSTPVKTPEKIAATEKPAAEKIVEKPAKAVPEKIAAAEKPVAEKTTGSGNAKEVMAAVNAWAQAWSDKDVATYLSHYASDFKTPGGEARDAWEKSRRERINKPGSIRVSVANPKVSFTDASHASVVFKQSYRSDTVKSNTAKTLVLVRTGEKWLIQQEQVGR